MFPPEVDRAWAAGFFDGEGWTGVTYARKHPVLRCALAQAQDYESLYRFASIVEVGKLYGPYQSKKKPHWSPQMFFYTHNEDAITLLSVILPYLGKVKTDQAVNSIFQWRKQRSALAVLAADRREELKQKTRERTHCRLGHAMTPENTYFASNDPLRPNCRECQRANGRRSYHKLKKLKT